MELELLMQNFKDEYLIEIELKKSFSMHSPTDQKLIISYMKEHWLEPNLVKMKKKAEIMSTINLAGIDQWAKDASRAANITETFCCVELTCDVTMESLLAFLECSSRGISDNLEEAYSELGKISSSWRNHLSSARSSVAKLNMLHMHSFYQYGGCEALSYLYNLAPVHMSFFNASVSPDDASLLAQDILGHIGSEYNSCKLHSLVPEETTALNKAKSSSKNKINKTFGYCSNRENFRTTAF